MMALMKLMSLIVYFELFIVQYTSADSMNMHCIETTKLIPVPPAPQDDEYQEEVEPRFFPEAPILINCSYVNLTDGPLPPDLDNKYDCEYCYMFEHILTVLNSSIPTIPASTFIHHPSTSTLILERCGIENILPGAFNILRSLKELYLSDNNIKFLADGVFNSLVNLKILDLSTNNIQNLSTHVFSGAFNIEKINMSHNYLKHIDSYTLLQVWRLREFDVSFNEIAMVNFTGFKVPYLNLSNNRIESVYECFGRFQRLNLKNNLLTSLENVSCNGNLSNTVTLDLSNNSLRRINKIPNLNNLEYLSLQNNELHFLSMDFFSDMGKLVFLNLSSNELEQFQYGLFDRLRNLGTLDVSNNHLTEFRKFNYHLLSNLHILNLNNNKIMTLDSKDITQILNSLVEICISGNNFTCDTLVDIIHDLKKITILPGHTFNSSNIHGIACSESEADTLPLEEFTNHNTTLEEPLRLNLNKLFNSDFTKSSMYNYFNKDFKKTNFYKYMENLQLSRNQNVNSHTTNVNILKDIEEFQKQFNRSVVDYFKNGFLNSTFVKYLGTFKSNEDFLKNDIQKSAMYNYFNRDFVNSNFYKYLEALKEPQFSIKYYNADTNTTKVEKLVDAHESVEQGNDNSGLLVVIIILLFLICCAMLSFVYVNYMKSRKIYSITNEQVELMET